MADRILARTLARAVARGMREYPDLAAVAGGPPEVRLVGLDPVRVLIVGAGLAVGYGVGTHDDALTGALARAMHAQTGRGAIVQNRAVRGQSVESTVGALGMLGAATFPLVVWCPSLFDIVRSPERGRYSRALLQGLQLLRSTAPEGARIVVCTIPTPTARGRLEDAARAIAPRYNGALRRMVAPLPGVEVAETPSFTTLGDVNAFPRGYYETWAGSVLQTGAARLDEVG